MKTFWHVLGLVMASLAVVTTGPVRAGNLEPPSGDPAGTMKTLDEIPGAWSRKRPCDFLLNCSRFPVVLSGQAVLDLETGLVWMQTPQVTNDDWGDAIRTCYFNFGLRGGWRLPTAPELYSLVDTSQAGGFPFAHPFTLPVVFTLFWTATEVPDNPDSVYVLGVKHPSAPAGIQMFSRAKTGPLPADTGAWCVRGAQ